MTRTRGGSASRSARGRPTWRRPCERRRQPERQAGLGPQRRGDLLGRVESSPSPARRGGRDRDDHPVEQLGRRPLGDRRAPPAARAEAVPRTSAPPPDPGRLPHTARPTRPGRDPGSASSAVPGHAAGTRIAHTAAPASRIPCAHSGAARRRDQTEQLREHECRSCDRSRRTRGAQNRRESRPFQRRNPSARGCPQRSPINVGPGDPAEHERPGLQQALVTGGSTIRSG